MQRFSLSVFSFCIAFSFFVSCDKKKDAVEPSESKSIPFENTDVNNNTSRNSNNDSILQFVDDAMNDIYLWDDKVTQVDWLDYTDPDKMMGDMIYLPIDRWSHVYSKEDLESFFTGESISYGFMPAWDGYDLRVMSVYKNSDAYRQGLRRGYRIAKLKNRNPQGILSWDFFNYPALGESLSMTAISLSDTISITISASDVVADKVMHHEIIPIDGKTAGYIVYESFTENSKDSLISVMEEFRVAGVTELIIDLRYNGGGETTVLMDWATKILPARYSGKPFFSIKHNSKNSMYDSVEYVYPDATSLGIERVFIIGTGNTASASEALINGLTPYVEVHLIGEATHGKPVGMYVFEFMDWYVLPISFEYTNALGDGGFYNGIQPEQYAFDDLRYDWGSELDPCLAQARYYIEHGDYSNTVMAAHLKSSMKPVVPMRNIGLISKQPAHLGK